VHSSILSATFQQSFYPGFHAEDNSESKISLFHVVALSGSLPLLLYASLRLFRKEIMVGIPSGSKDPLLR